MAHLYFTKESCGAASYIAAKRGGVKFDSYNLVDLEKHTLLRTGEDFYSLNPKGNVPCIIFETGLVLNENVGTLYWIAKNSVQNELLGKTADDEYAAVNLLSYIATEVHTLFHFLFGAKDPALKQSMMDELSKKFDYISKVYLEEGKNEYLLGRAFTVPDAYLYIVLTWTKFVGVDISGFEALTQYFHKVGALPFIKEAHQEMLALENQQKGQLDQAASPP